MQFIQNLSRQQTLALIGGGCSLVTEQVVMIAHEKLIPVVSSGQFMQDESQHIFCSYHNIIKVKIFI